MNSTRSSANVSAASRATTRCARWMGSKVPPKIAVLIKSSQKTPLPVFDFDPDFQPQQLLRLRRFARHLFAEIHHVFLRGHQGFSAAIGRLLRQPLQFRRPIG